jgi:two-component sensor histidine kinase
MNTHSISSGEAEKRLRFLAESGVALVSSLDYVATLQRVAELSVGALCDYCIFDVLDGDGSLRRIAWAHIDRNWPHLRELGRFAPPSNADDHPIIRVIHTGEPVLVPDFDDSWMDRITWSGEHLAMMRKLAAHSAMFVPLTAHGSTVGAGIFAFSQSKDRRHSKADLELAVELGRRVGLAVLHARQYEALKTSEARLRELAEHQRLLINELNHRVKNTLATVQAMATQTLRGNDTPERAGEAFTRRLMALARAHDVLTRRNWEGADLADIVAGVIEAHRPERDDRFEVAGGTLQLNPRTALSVAMILHELATNATKYGALSNEEGRVSITWKANGETHPAFQLRWQERGGPTVAPPSRRGFGTRLIERGFSAETAGRTDITYEPEGVVCVLSAELQ